MSDHTADWVSPTSCLHLSCPLPGLPHARVSALRQLGPPKHQAKRIITDSPLTMATCREVARRRSPSQ